MSANRSNRRDFLKRAGVAGLAAPAAFASGTAVAGDAGKPKVAVVTGGHAYDVINFHKFFRTLDGVDPYIQHMDDFAAGDENVRDSYEVVLFYIMLPGAPVDEGTPWYRGRPQMAMEHLGATKQGIIVLHHGVLAYPEWPAWGELVGIPDRKLEGYKHGQKMQIKIAAPNHPITKGMKPFTIVDETYNMKSPGEGSEALLTTDLPESIKTVGWTRQYKNARVFCLQLGHDNESWSNPNFRTLIERGALWCARKT